VTAADLLRDLEARGVILEARGDRLRVTAPLGALSPDVVEALRRHKAELLALVAGEPRPFPYLSPRGDLVIPFGADSNLCWWKGGRSVEDTLDDLDAPADMRARYEHLH